LSILIVKEMELFFYAWKKIGGTEATQNVSGIITGSISIKGAAPPYFLVSQGF
jgi:hypothetical protein